LDVADLQMQIDLLGGIGRQGMLFQQPPNAVVNQAKNELEKLKSKSYSFTVQTLDADHVSRLMVFVTFVSTWLVRFADPAKKHPNPPVK